MVLSTKSRIEDMCNGMATFHECNEMLLKAFGESSKKYSKHYRMSHILNEFNQHQDIKKRLYEFLDSEIKHVAYMTDEEIYHYLQNERVDFIDAVYSGKFKKAFGVWTEIVDKMKNIDEPMHNEQFKNDIKLWESNEYGIQR